MTMFDEEKLQRALREAAEGFAVSEGAIDSILDEARESPGSEKQRRIRSLVERTGRVRSTAMVAAACVVVLAVAVPLFNSEGTPRVEVHNNALKEFNPLGAPATATPGAPNSGLQGTTVTNTSGSGFQGTTVTNTSGSFSVAVPTSSKTIGKSGVNASEESLVTSLRVEEVGTIQLTVGGQKFQSTLTQLTDFATTDGGFVASTQSHIGTKASHSFSTGTIVLQVPERNFTMLVDQVRHSGFATSVVTSANDVTGQYVDLQARISALQVSRTQYLKIMSRTNSIGGILSVQEQLNSIQSQIEQYQAQLNLLNSETTYATLTVSLSESGHQAIAHKHPATGVDKAWHESLHGFAAGIEWLIRIAGPLLFALLVLAALLALGRLTWRANERRRSRIN
jgi:hypothetical protein